MSNASIKHISVSRTARYVVIGNPQAEERWLVVHGYGQLAPRFAQKFASLAGQHRCFVVPEALNRFYVSGFSGKVGATWMTAEDREKDIADNVAYLDVLHLEAGFEFNAVFGFSQGVATLCRWMQHRRPEGARAIFWAGSVAREMEQWSEQDACFLASGSLHYVFGDNDPFFSESKISEQFAILRRLQISFDALRFEGKHVIDKGLLHQLIASSEDIKCAK